FVPTASSCAASGCHGSSSPGIRICDARRPGRTMTALRGPRGWPVTLIGAALLAASVSTVEGAPTILGPNKCTSCHDHDKQKAWADKDTHAKALTQLEDKKAAGYAKAIGLADPYDLKGSCVGCHATVFSGDANAGVSCETCQGAGSDY